MERRCVAAFVALSAALFAGTPDAHAAAPTPVTARLEWQRAAGAESCIDIDSLTRAVNARWGRDVFAGSSANADLVARGSVRRAAGGYSATIELVQLGGRSLGSRTLSTRQASCRALDDSVALALGLMLDVSRARVEEERQQAGLGVGAAPVAGSPLDIPRATDAPTDARRPWAFEISASGAVAFGLLPSTAFGGRIGVAVTPPAFARVELGASLFAPREAELESGRGVRATAYVVDAGLCFDEGHGARLAFDGCLVERLGGVHAEGFGFSETNTTSDLLFDVGAREVVRYRFSSAVALRLGLSLAVPLVRYRFVFDDSANDRRVVHEMGRVTGGADLGVAFGW